jgi:ABC-type cobalamin/Fe3+-siderophores transport system ATPase subunit
MATATGHGRFRALPAAGAELLAVIGPGGSGRSSLLHALGQRWARRSALSGNAPSGDGRGSVAVVRTPREVPYCADQLLLALAAVLTEEPQAVVVDSADDGLDAVGRRRVWARLRRVADSGTTVVAACRSAETAGAYAHRTVLLPHRGGLGGTPHRAGHHLSGYQRP